LTRVYHRNMPDLARVFCVHRRPTAYTRPMQQLEVGWARLARAMLFAPTISLDFSRLRGGRSDLHGRPKRMKAPEYCKIGAGRTEYCKIGAGRTQRQGCSDRTASLASQRPVARESASGSTGLTGRVRIYASTREIRATTCVTGRPRHSARRAKEGFRRRVRRQPGGSSGRH
jgi:hypothetical protein